MKTLLFSLALAVGLTCPSANAKEKAARKPANEIVSSAGITRELQAAIETHWMFKTIKKHYKTFDVYQANLEDSKSNNPNQDGDKLITIAYSTYNEKAKNSPEDSVSFTAAYLVKEKRVVNMTVSQGPCWSDMCGP